MTYPPIGLGPAWSIYTERPRLDPWPEPASPAVVVDDFERPAVVALVALANAHGWIVKVTRAEGAWPTVGQKPSRQRVSLAVRMHRDAQYAVAVYVEPITEGGTWAWETMLFRIGEWIGKSFSIGVFMDEVFGLLCRPSWPTDWTCPYFGPLHGPAKPKRVA